MKAEINSFVSMVKTWNLDKMMKSKDKAVTVLTKGVEFLLKKNKVTYFKGHGSFKSKNEILIKDDKNKETIIQTEKTVIATGSVPVSLPGIEIDEKTIVSSTGALKLEKVPKKMVVVGGGYIGLEMGSVWSRLGAEVQVVEFLDHITPGMDKEMEAQGVTTDGRGHLFVCDGNPGNGEAGLGEPSLIRWNQETSSLVVAHRLNWRWIISVVAVESVSG